MCTMGWCPPGTIEAPQDPPSPRRPPVTGVAKCSQATLSSIPVNVQILVSRSYFHNPLICVLSSSLPPLT